MLSLNRERKFWGFVLIGDDCWEWRGRKNWGGYGRFWIGDGQTKPAHRVAYELIVGRIPDGLTLDHLCRNRGCVNPNHLEPVTMRENLLRGVGPTARNARKTHCKRGHEFTPENTYRYRGERVCKACEAERYQRKKAGPSSIRTLVEGRDE